MWRWATSPRRRPQRRRTFALLFSLVVLAPAATSASAALCPDHDTDAFRIGFLSTFSHAKVVLGALPLAVERANAAGLLAARGGLCFEAADVGVAPNDTQPAVQASRNAITSMSRMRDLGAVAFISTDDACFDEALVSAAWNIPFISSKCTDTRVTESKVFQTFARTLPPSSKVSKPVVALLKNFQWDQFVIVVGRRQEWNQLKDAVIEIAKQHNLTVTGTFQFSDYIPKNINVMKKIVEETYKITRVYVFIGEHVALVDLVKCLQHRKLLDTGEYIIVSVDDQIYDPDNKLSTVQRDYIDPYLRMAEHANLTFWGDHPPQLSKRDITGFRSVLKLTQSYPRNPEYTEFCNKTRTLASKDPFKVPDHPTLFKTLEVPIHAAHLFDAVGIYARAVNETLEAGEDPRNGTAIFNRVRNRTYHSVQGYDVYIDMQGDAEGNYTVVALLDDASADSPVPMSMQAIGFFQQSPAQDLPVFRYLNESRQIQWVGGEMPRAEPPCGFHGEKCEYPLDWRVTAPLGAIAALVVVAAVFLFRHYRYEQKLACLLWKVDFREITTIPTQSVHLSTCATVGLFRNTAAGNVSEPQPEPEVKRAFTTIGFYRGTIVAIKLLNKKNVDLTRSILKELIQMREVRHENLSQFVGACVDTNSICILTNYCARGSLEDVLYNPDLCLDPIFISSLVSDILKGLIYLHDSEVISHGNLRTSNCLVDSRWVLQISDFGLHEFRAGHEEADKEYAVHKRLWRAPELLRDANAPARGTQKGDVYSFGIILYEVFERNGPWGGIRLSDAEIIARVIAGDAGDIFYELNNDPPANTPRLLRPPTGELKVADYVVRTMKSCWEEEPELRPDIRFVRVKLKEMQTGLKANIFDNMLAIMEKYAYNLEGLVQERTNQLTEEKKKTDALLYRMLPRSVADALKKGNFLAPESFDCVTIYFSDIVGFTELSARSTPLQVVELLNDLYIYFDNIISHYDVYKVETIGDAYMVVSGLPIRNDEKHASEIASMAMHLLSKIKRFKIPHQPKELLKLRIGIHSGQCVAGVVGLKMPRYCLFGDTVNTASRMESSGEEFKVHISEATYLLLQKEGGFICEERGITKIKGKGEMLTYWLTGEEANGNSHRRNLLDNMDEIVYGPYNSNSYTPDLLKRYRNVPSLELSPLSLHNLQSPSSCFQEFLRRSSSPTNDLTPHPRVFSGNRSAPTVSFSAPYTDFLALEIKMQHSLANLV